MAASDQVVFHVQEQKGDLLVTEVRLHGRMSRHARPSGG